PTPKVALEFWKSRYEDLKYIYNQLRTITVRGMAKLLDKLQSSYFPAFKAMYRDVVADGTAISWPFEHQTRSTLIKIAKPAKSMIRSR
ncbi:DNAH9 isoform 14, partial [Pongo abelii]